MSEHERYQDLKDQGYVMVSLISEASPGEQPTQESVTSFADSLELSYPVAFDPDAFPAAAWQGYAEEFGDAVPMYLFFDPKQELQTQILGYDERRITETLESLLER